VAPALPLSRRRDERTRPPRLRRAPGHDVRRRVGRAVRRLEVAERPAIERHEGPPVHVGEHARGFYEKYADTDAAGPYVDGDRYVVERARAHPSAPDLLRSDALFDVALGAHVESALEEGYDALIGDDVAALAEPFGVELARYFDPKP